MEWQLIERRDTVFQGRDRRACQVTHVRIVGIFMENIFAIRNEWKSCLVRIREKKRKREFCIYIFTCIQELHGYRWGKVYPSFCNRWIFPRSTTARCTVCLNWRMGRDTKNRSLVACQDTILIRSWRPAIYCDVWNVVRKQRLRKPHDMIKFIIIYIVVCFK